MGRWTWRSAVVGAASTRLQKIQCSAFHDHKAALSKINASLPELPSGDERLAINRNTTVPLDWIGKRLHMGTRSRVSRLAEAAGKGSPMTRSWPGTTG